MNAVPTNVRTWLVESTLCDVRSVLAGYLYDGADLDKDDVADIRRTVVCDSIILGINQSQILLPLIFVSRVRDTTEIPGYFLGVMERSLNLKSPPLTFAKNPLKTAAHLAHQIDQAIEKKMGRTWLNAAFFNSVNDPSWFVNPQIDQDLT